MFIFKFKGTVSDISRWMPPVIRLLCSCFRNYPANTGGVRIKTSWRIAQMQIMSRIYNCSVVDGQINIMKTLNDAVYLLWQMALHIIYVRVFVCVCVCFSDRSWLSFWRGSKLWKSEVNLHRPSSPLSPAHRQRATRTLESEQVRRRGTRGSLEVERRRRRRGEEEKSWREKGRNQRWLSRQTGGSTGTGYVTHRDYVKEDLGARGSVIYIYIYIYIKCPAT